MNGKTCPSCAAEVRNLPDSGEDPRARVREETAATPVPLVLPGLGLPREAIGQQPIIVPPISMAPLAVQTPKLPVQLDDLAHSSELGPPSLFVTTSREAEPPDIDVPYYTRLTAGTDVGGWFCTALSKVSLLLAMAPWVPDFGRTGDNFLKLVIRLNGKRSGQSRENQYIELREFQRRYYPGIECTIYSSNAGSRHSLAKFFEPNLPPGVSWCCLLEALLKEGNFGALIHVDVPSKGISHVMILVGVNCSDPNRCVLTLYDQSNGGAPVTVSIPIPVQVGTFGDNAGEGVSGTIDGLAGTREPEIGVISGIITELLST
jgi:hypothetical protein